MNNEKQSHSNKYPLICINAKLKQNGRLNLSSFEIKFEAQMNAFVLPTQFSSSLRVYLLLPACSNYLCNKEIWFITTIILMRVLFPFGRFTPQISNRISYWLPIAKIMTEGEAIYCLKSFLIKIFTLSQSSEFGKRFWFVKISINMVDMLNNNWKGCNMRIYSPKLYSPYQMKVLCE